MAEKMSESIASAAAFAAGKLSPHQCQKIYHTALDALERFGVQLYEPAAIDLLKKSGVTRIDGCQVYIPARLVEQALKTVPRSISFYDRNNALAMTVEGRRTYAGTGSGSMHILDHRSGKRRLPLLADIKKGMIVCDALPHIDYVMSLFLPSEVQPDRVELYQAEAMLAYTRKPICFVASNLERCRKIVDMLEIVAGGANELRKNPHGFCHTSSLTGFRHEAGSLQKLLFLARKGIPFTYVGAAAGGATAPVTVAAAMTVAHVGTLVGVVLSQLAREGAPILINGYGGQMLDLQTLVQPYADPERRGQCTDFAHFLGLPMFCAAGCSESKALDQQAAAEAALTLFAEYLFGGNLIHCIGYLESALCTSLQQIVVCDEIISWIKAFMQPVTVTDETLGLDVIEQVGILGNYLATEHTQAHYRQRWYPMLMDRNPYHRWEKAGAQTLGRRAAERVETILMTHQPEPLTPLIARKLRGIVTGEK